MKILIQYLLLVGVSAFTNLEDYHETFADFTPVVPASSLAQTNATAEYITLRGGGAVWQLLTSREGGVAFTGYVNVGNVALPTVIDTGSTSMICLSCRCPSCAGPRSSLFSACHKYF